MTLVEAELRHRQETPSAEAFAHRPGPTESFRHQFNGALRRVVVPEIDVDAGPLREHLRLLVLVGHLPPLVVVRHVEQQLFGAVGVDRGVAGGGPALVRVRPERYHMGIVLEHTRRADPVVRVVGRDLEPAVEDLFGPDRVLHRFPGDEQPDLGLAGYGRSGAGLLVIVHVEPEHRALLYQHAVAVRQHAGLAALGGAAQPDASVHIGGGPLALDGAAVLNAAPVGPHLFVRGVDPHAHVVRDAVVADPQFRSPHPHVLGQVRCGQLLVERDEVVTVWANDLRRARDRSPD